MSAARPLSRSLADFAEAFLGLRLEPWQRDLVNALDRPRAWPALTDAGLAALRRFLEAEAAGKLEAVGGQVGGYIRLRSGRGQDKATLAKLKRDGYAIGSWEQGRWMRITDTGRVAVERANRKEFRP